MSAGACARLARTRPATADDRCRAVDVVANGDAQLAAAGFLPPSTCASASALAREPYALTPFVADADAERLAPHAAFVVRLLLRHYALVHCAADALRAPLAPTALRVPLPRAAVVAIDVASIRERREGASPSAAADDVVARLAGARSFVGALSTRAALFGARTAANVRWQPVPSLALLPLSSASASSSSSSASSNTPARWLWTGARQLVCVRCVDMSVCLSVRWF